MIAVFLHELKAYFTSLTAYVYGLFLLFFVGIYMMKYNLVQSYANFEFALAGASFAFIIIVPVLTMRIIAEEKKQKTDQLLYSLPVSTSQIVIGKYLALLVTSLVPMCVAVFYPLILRSYGNLYLPTAYGAMFACALMGAVLLSVGMFISSLTESQAMAAGICFAVMLLNYYMVTLAEYAAGSSYGSLIAILILEIVLALLVDHMTKNDTLATIVGMAMMIVTVILYYFQNSWFEGLFPKVLQTLSVYERFYEFVDGIFDYTHVVYFISVVIFFLFLTVQSLEKRRYN